HTARVLHSFPTRRSSDLSFPTEIDPKTLQTLGTWNCGNRLKSKTMTAHPKVDPDTGEWWSCGVFAHKRYEGETTLQVIDRNGKLDRKSTRLNSSHVSISY